MNSSFSSTFQIEHYDEGMGVGNANNSVYTAQPTQSPIHEAKPQTTTDLV